MSLRNGWTSSLSALARRALTPTLPAPCFRCGLLVGTRDTWDVEHKTPIADGGSLTDPANWAVSHASCNRRDGATIRHQNRGRVRRWI